MPILKSAGRLLLAGSAILVLSAAAEAQMRYIASSGKDSNSCKTPATACRSLQRGINVTPAGGELRVLNSAPYGNGQINKTMTISADDETLLLSNPLTIDAAGAVVTLRGLSLNGAYKAAGGIHIAGASAVHIDNCTVEHFTGTGIESDSNNTELFVTDSASRDNGGPGLSITGASTLLTVDNSRFENNGGTGIAGNGSVGSVTRTVLAGNNGHSIVWGGGSLAVVSSMAGNNVGDGYFVHSSGWIHLESSVARGNAGAGLSVEANSVASLSNFVATGNQWGIYNGGTVLTRQNNTLYGNATSITGAQPTALPPI